VVAGVGGSDVAVLAAGLPVKLAAVHDDAAQRGAVAADELGGRVDDDVRAVLDGTDEVRGAKGVINDQRQAVLVGDGRDGVDVGDVTVGVAQSLEVDGLGVGLDRVLDLFQVMCIHEGGGDAELGQGVLQQVIAAAVDGLLGHDVVAGLRQRLDGVGDGRRAGSGGQSSDAALERRDTLLEHVLRGVGQTAIDVSGVGQTEAVSGVLAVAEDVGGGLVDGDGAGIGGGVGLLLTDVELQSLKLIIRHSIFPLYLYSKYYFAHKNPRQRRSSHLSSAGQRNHSPLRTFCLSWASHSLAHSRHRGHRTALAQSFFLSPGAVHSPTAEVGVQKIFPNQRHLSTLLSESSLNL